MRNLTLVLLIFLVSACGQKGPLFLPESKQETATLSSSTSGSPPIEARLKSSPAPDKDEFKSQLKANRNSTTP